MMRYHDQRGVILIHAIVMMGFVSLVVVVIAGGLTARAMAVRDPPER